MYIYRYPRPAVTVDLIIIRKNTDDEILLIKRGQNPYKDFYALPGGFIDEFESPEKAAYRELKEETGLECHNLIQYKTYGEPGRDPRGHTISIVYWGIDGSRTLVRGMDDATEARWFELFDLPELAFDHKKIINEFITSGLINP